MSGWISLHRKVQNHWLFEEERKFSKFEAWIDLLFMANHKDNKTLLGNELITVKRGQRITSLRQLSDRWGWSITKVDRFLKLLEDDEMLIVKKDSKKTLVTIVNYDLYQSDEFKKRHKKDTNDTRTIHERNANETRTKTNNNDNKENNGNKDNNDNKNNATREIISFYENNGYGTINGTESERIVGWLEEGFTKDAIIKAYQIGVDNNKRGKSYIDGIFRNWRNAKTFTLQEIEANDQKRQPRRWVGKQQWNNKASSISPENQKLMEERAAQRAADMEGDDLPF